MKSNAFILFPNSESCRIALVSNGAKSPRFETVATEATSPADAAPRIAGALRAMGRRNEPVLLAVPSAWCLAARISLDGLPRGDRRAMAFRLEEKLPVAAEDVVADCIVDRDGRHALGVAVRIDRLRPWVDALESAGVSVASISPAALLAAEAIAGPTTADRLLLLDEPDDQVSLVLKTAAGQTAWAVATATPQDLAMHRQILQMQIDGPGGADRALTVVCSGGVDASRLGLPPGTLRDETTAEQLATVPAAIDLSGRGAPPIELRRDALAPADRMQQIRRPLNAVLAAAAVLLIAVAVTCVVRGWRYDRAARAFDAELIDQFTRAFPGQAVPPDVRWFVESEHRRMFGAGVGAGAGAGGGAGNELPAQLRRSAATTMRQVLTSIPPDAKLSLDRLTFTDAGFELRGRVESAAMVDAIGARLRAAGFDVVPAQSTRDADGFWAFTLSGGLKQAQSVARGG